MFSTMSWGFSNLWPMACVCTRVCLCVESEGDKSSGGGETRKPAACVELVEIRTCICGIRLGYWDPEGLRLRLSTEPQPVCPLLLLCHSPSCLGKSLWFTSASFFMLFLILLSKIKKRIRSPHLCLRLKFLPLYQLPNHDPVWLLEPHTGQTQEYVKLDFWGDGEVNLWVWGKDRKCMICKYLYVHVLRKSIINVLFFFVVLFSVILNCDICLTLLF